MNSKEENKDNIKEEFCGVCAIPIAVGLAGGAGLVGTSSTKKHKNTKIIIFWSLIISFLLIVIYIIYQNMSGGGNGCPI
jgi:hypothetical protein